jgi:hypothetical protein
MKKIIVKNSGFVKLKGFNDFPDGNLVIAEAKKNVPIDIKRVYVINKLFNFKSKRGHHAHKKLEQIIFCVNGSFKIKLDDGTNEQVILMKDPSVGIILGKELWHKMFAFTSDCVIMVLANDYFNESDYIRSYDEFLKYIREKNNLK